MGTREQIERPGAIDSNSLTVHAEWSPEQEAAWKRIVGRYEREMRCEHETNRDHLQPGIKSQ